MKEDKTNENNSKTAEILRTIAEETGRGTAAGARKVTVKDVAEAAGVSVATVSYVLNDTPGQKISPETRKKVLQMANLLNYRASHAAKSLALGRSNVIGIAFSLIPSAPSRSLELSFLVQSLTNRLHRMNYDVLLMDIPEGETITVNRTIDAIIAVDLPHDKFRLLAGNYLVPVIGVDMIIGDDLFYQIYTDFPTYIKKAAKALKTPLKDAYLISDRFSNDAIFKYVASSVPKGHFIASDELNEGTVKKLKGCKVIVLGEYLALTLLRDIPAGNMAVITGKIKTPALPAEVSVILSDSSKKANLTVNILLNTIDRKFDVSHDHKV